MSLVTPIFDPNRGWRMWHRPEIFTGPSGTGRYVPNIDDLILDYTQGFFRVINVDYSTGISTLDLWILPKDSEGLTNEDILLGAGPGTVSENFRCYINTDVVPHTLNVSGYLHIYGSSAHSVKIFKGVDTGASGVVVSQYYNQNGNLVGENIPLELVVMPGQNNVAVKCVKPGYSNRALANGEVVTVVVYDQVGGVLSIARLLVENTNFVRTADASAKYITGIRILSPFISETDTRLLEYPVNITLDSNHIMGEVSFNNGDKDILPVDGGKFSLHGLNNFISTTAGQRLQLVLSYKMSPGEFTVSGVVSENYHINEPYELVTVAAQGAYAVKLFGYPKWLDSVRGYMMEYWLYNLDRDTIEYATPWVEMHSASAPFQPTLYGTAQDIAVSIDLANLGSQFSSYRYVQSMTITLVRRGDVLQTPNWTIGFSPNQDPPYGTNAVAKMTFMNVNQWQMDLRCGCASQEEWLNTLYYRAEPLYNPSAELNAPTPTHFTAVFANRVIEFSIDQWDQISMVPNDLTQGQWLGLRFSRKTANNEFQLALAALPVHHL